ncbi:HAD family hydrolase [Muricoccus radiodurans]|uniref:HAD family hydrolase n=1 Tax=Muricoccus radiodurans TaxID=2231721 RepID=UPI003CEB1238
MLLLLDLDGVVVFEASPPQVQAMEILLLHELLGEMLTELALPVVVLTHRSRREATRILRAAGLEEGRELAGVMAAEDLFQAALRHGGPLRLLSRGLRKSWILPVIEQRFGVPRGKIAFIDDRLDNLEDLLAHGIGLGLHAPSAIADDGASLTSFDIRELVSQLREWQAAPRKPGLITLRPQQYDLMAWRRTGLHTRHEGRHAFNLARATARRVRALLSRG